MFNKQLIESKTSSNAIVEYKLPKNKQNELSAFMSTMGLKNSLLLCKAGENLYVACDPLANLLAVKLVDFITSAKTPIDYVKYKGAVCVSKYGITKLIAKSTQPVAYKIQDYMYDLLYRVETGEVDELVDKSIDSRNKLMVELEEYELIVNSAKNHSADLAAADQTLRRLQDENRYLSDELEETKTTLAEYMDIANKLGRFVRLKPNAPVEASSTLLDLDDYDSDTIVAQAMEAKKALKPKKKKPTQHNEYCVAYLYRSAGSIDGKYQFECQTEKPDEHLIYLSNNWLLDEIGNPPADPIYYDSFECTKQALMILQTVLEFYNGFIEEELMKKILVL